MGETSRHDAWQAGDSYDSYMGRWSRQIAPLFLDWLGAPEGKDWLDIGCGTGALSASIAAQSNPASLISIDPSEGFLETARANVPDTRIEFKVGDAQALPIATASRDVVVSALVLNFVPDKAKALLEMKRVARKGSVVGFYVWDYPGGGVQFMRAFWTAATALNPDASDFREDKRFPFCTLDGLTKLAKDAKLISIESTAIEVPTVFKSFDDYWNPFTLGAGPAPGYCMSLTTQARQRLKEKLQEDLPQSEDGSIHLKSRAWAVKTDSGQ